MSKTNAVPKGRTGVKLGSGNRESGLAYGVLVFHKSCPLQFSATPTLGFSSSSLSSPNLSLSFFPLQLPSPTHFFFLPSLSLEL